jgi:hypothetical protein
MPKKGEEACTGGKCPEETPRHEGADGDGQGESGGSGKADEPDVVEPTSKSQYLECIQRGKKKYDDKCV